MDNFRLILFFALAFTLLMLYQAWMADYGQPRPAVSQTAPGITGQEPGSTTAVPAPNAQDASVVPAPVGGTPVAATPLAGAPTVKVETDLLQAEISLRGGTISKLLLKDYRVDANDPNSRFPLLKELPPNMFIAQSGFIGVDKDSAPTHDALFQSEQTSLTLAEGQDQIQLDMHWVSAAGVKVTKRYTFHRGSYVVDVAHLVENASAADWTGRAYHQLQRTDLEKVTGSGMGTPTYTGGAIYSPVDKYRKVSFDDIAEEPLSLDVSGGWVAMMQHYFLGAWIPPEELAEHFYSNALPEGRYVLGTYSPSLSVPAGGSAVAESRLYVGPKLQDALANIAPGLELSVDYGWLTVLAQPLFWLLNKIYGIVGNWGWAIILLTILIKAAFYKLSEASYKSMAKMRKFTPRLQALKDRYGDDKQRLNQAMMEMYKKEKINPLGGCLPILVQIPVFIALYWVLLDSVELRQAPFALWLNNLSEKDPYFVLPLIMGVSMWVQQKLNPAPPDPMQAKIMQSLPFVFTVFFAFFPAGLVLYWVVNNLLSILQQWYITRSMEQAGQA